MEKGVRLIGNGQSPANKYMKEILEKYLIPGLINPLDLIVSHRIKLEDTAKMYEVFDKRVSPVFTFFYFCFSF